VKFASVRWTPQITRKVVRDSMASQEEMEGEGLVPFTDVNFCNVLVYDGNAAIGSSSIAGNEFDDK
jgi:hypothetical protein